jgi:hypothetical protein
VLLIEPFVFCIALIAMGAIFLAIPCLSLTSPALSLAHAAASPHIRVASPTGLFALAAA